MRWIVATTRPGVTVTLGDGDSDGAAAIRAALAETGAGARYIAVGTGDRRVDGEPSPRRHRWPMRPPRTIFEDFDSEEDATRPLSAAELGVDLLHVAVSERTRRPRWT